jgi:hypothetical protein
MLPTYVSDFVATPDGMALVEAGSQTIAPELFNIFKGHAPGGINSRPA